MIENGIEQKESSWSVCVIGLIPKLYGDKPLTIEDPWLIADAALSKVWRCAVNESVEAMQKKAGQPSFKHKRVPTFIVIDEAQLFASDKSTSTELQFRVRDKIERIAAEGRKYGLFLILSTQRPSKISPSIVYECENTALLRLQSPKELEFAQDAFGIKTVFAETVPSHKTGHALLTGRWAGNENHKYVMGALMRSQPGGTNLRDEAWMDGNEWEHDASRRPYFNHKNNNLSTAKSMKPIAPPSSEGIINKSEKKNQTLTIVEIIVNAMSSQQQIEEFATRLCNTSKWDACILAANKLAKYPEKDNIRLGLISKCKFNKLKNTKDEFEKVELLHDAKKWFSNIDVMNSDPIILEMKAHFTKDYISAAESLHYYNRFKECAKGNKDLLSRSYRLLGVALEELKRYPEAETAFKNALEVNSSDSLSMAYLSRLLVILGKIDESKKCIISALENDDVVMQANLILKELCRSLKMNHEYQICLQSLIEESITRGSYDQVLIYYKELEVAKRNSI